MKKEVNTGQCLIDVAIESSGDAAGIVELSRLNDVPLDACFEATTELFVQVIRKEVVVFYESKDIKVVTWQEA